MPPANVLRHLLSTSSIPSSRVAETLRVTRARASQLVGGDPIPPAHRLALDGLTAKGTGPTVHYVLCTEVKVLGETRFYVIDNGEGAYGYCLQPEWADRLAGVLTALGYTAGVIPCRDSEMQNLAEYQAMRRKLDEPADPIHLDVGTADPNAIAARILAYVAAAVARLPGEDPDALGQVAIPEPFPIPKAETPKRTKARA